MLEATEKGMKNILPMRRKQWWAGRDLEPVKRECSHPDRCFLWASLRGAGRTSPPAFWGPISASAHTSCGQRGWVALERGKHKTQHIKTTNHAL